MHFYPEQRAAIALPARPSFSMSAFFKDSDVTVRETYGQPADAFLSKVIGRESSFVHVNTKTSESASRCGVADHEKRVSCNRGTRILRSWGERTIFTINRYCGSDGLSVLFLRGFSGARPPCLAGRFIEEQTLGKQFFKFKA